MSTVEITRMNWYSLSLEILTKQAAALQNDQDLLDFLCKFLGYTEMHTTGSHRKFVKNSWNTLSVKFPTNAHIQMTLQHIGRGWRNAWLEEYIKDSKRLIKDKKQRGEQAIIDFENYCKRFVDKKEEAKQTSVLTQQQLNSIFSKFPFMKSQYQIMQKEVEQGNMDNESLYNSMIQYL